MFLQPTLTLNDFVPSAFCQSNLAQWNIVCLPGIPPALATAREPSVRLHRIIRLRNLDLSPYRNLLAIPTYHSPNKQHISKWYNCRSSMCIHQQPLLRFSILVRDSIDLYVSLADGWFCMPHVVNQDSLPTLFDKLGKKAHADYDGQEVGLGWLKYEYNGTIWDLDDGTFFSHPLSHNSRSSRRTIIL